MTQPDPPAQFQFDVTSTSPTDSPSDVTRSHFDVKVEFQVPDDPWKVIGGSVESEQPVKEEQEFIDERL